MLNIRLLARLLIRFLTPLKIRILIGSSIRSLRQRKDKSEMKQSVELSKLFSNTQILNTTPVLDSSEDPEHDFLILASSQHKELAFLNIQNLRHVYGRNVTINLVYKGTAENFFRGRQSGFDNGVRFYSESEFDSELERLNTVLRNFNPDRRTWLWQQCLKTIFVARNSRPILVLDSDTFITEKVDFLNNGKSVLLAGSKEHFQLHTPYSRHVEKFLRIQTLPINFTHHCQLQKPERIREIYSRDVLEGLEKWLLLGKRAFEFSPVGEYQTYGEYMRANYPSEIALLNPRHHIVIARKTTTREEIFGNEEFQMHQKQRCESGCSLFTVFL